MKMLLVETCENCPYKEWRDSTCSRYSYEKYDCTLGVKGDVKELAAETKFVISQESFNPITQEVTKEKSRWGYSADGVTEWNYKIPSWCELKDVP